MASWLPALVVGRSAVYALEPMRPLQHGRLGLGLGVPMGKEAEPTF